MNRLSFALIAAALSVVSALANAQQLCDAKTKPTACFVDRALTSLDRCQRLPVATNDSSACVGEGETRIEPIYENAIYASDRNAHTSLLKDFYASWRTAMNGVHPNAGERATAYKARQSANRNALEAKADQLKSD
jgi:hypothetical protein